jgi:hypothetical protein
VSQAGVVTPVRVDHTNANSAGGLTAGEADARFPPRVGGNVQRFEPDFVAVAQVARVGEPMSRGRMYRDVTLRNRGPFRQLKHQVPKNVRCDRPDRSSVGGHEISERIDRAAVLVDHV